MATKPGVVPRWASGGAADVVAPSSGKQDLGWLAGEHPPASYLNWLAELYYEWHLYVSDGAFQGPHTFDSTVGITGALTGAAATFSGLITASAGLTAAANQHVTVSGTGHFKHGSRFKYIAPCSGMGTGGTTITDPGHAQVPGTEKLFIPIDLNEGERIRSVSVYHSQTAAGTVTARLQYNANDGTLPTFIDTDTSTETDWGLHIELTGLTYTMASNRSVFLRMTSSTGGALNVGSVVVEYDRP